MTKNVIECLSDYSRQHVDSRVENDTINQKLE